MPTLTIATRRSPLALAQTNRVADALRATGVEVRLLELVTTGDRWSAAGNADATRGLFVKELEEALLDGRADLAVHSAKDLPGELPPGLAVLAVPAREDARDVLVGPEGGLAALPPGARVGTGSPRRVVQLGLARPDLRFGEVRGNVGTRLEKLGRGEFDALVLAAAGLNRLGLTPAGRTPLDPTVCVPAPGQGALALEGRADDESVRAAVAVLDDPVTHACLLVERAVLAGLGGGCREPIGALAHRDGDGIALTAFAADATGRTHARQTTRIPMGPPGEQVAALVATLTSTVGSG